jgi:hypothetical protein
MKQITEITDNPRQSLTITTDRGDEFILKLNYSDLQQAWFYDITFGEVVINGRKIVNSPNILRSFKNVIPFGITVAVTDAGEPMFIDDFTSSRCSLFILESDEVTANESEFYNE